MDIPESTVTDLTRRLRRVEGQIRGIQQMLATERDCRDIVTQMSAASKALDQVGFLLVASGLSWSIAIKPENILAIGDNYNDVEMIAYAGIGVAMGNAPADVQAIANWIAPDVDADGVAVAIEKFILA